MCTLPGAARGLAETNVKPRFGSLIVAQGLARGTLSDAHPRLISSSGLKRRCSPPRTKPDLAEQKNQYD